jgi:hypothetical protein
MTTTKKAKKQIILERIQSERDIYTVGGDVNLFSHYENQCGGSLKTKGN